MNTDLPKTYDPAAVEPQADQAWSDANAFHAEPTNPGTPYSIVIPPPNVTAALHLGHALNNTLQDILIRWHRMTGENTCWLPGTDHAGIATQTVVEKRVLAEEGKRRTDFAREEFTAKIQAWKDEYEARITQQLKRMGCSCDWARQAFTMDEPRAKAVREAFFQLFKDGLIYRGKRLVNWDPATQTALADDEVEMEEVDGHFYYLRYPIVEESDEATKRRSDGGEMAYVTVATTRPETMLGDTAVAINPRDPRAAQLRGKKVRLPIVNRIVPIIEDDYVVLPVSLGGDKDDPKAQFATGFLKVTPAHDPNDWELGQRHNLPVINVLSPTATISKDHGWPAEDFAQGNDELKNLLGMDRFEAREAVVEFFRKEKLLEEIKPYKHTVGHSYRSHVPIEPYLSDQWYCKVTDPRLAQAALRAMAADQVEESSTTIATRHDREGVRRAQPVSNPTARTQPAQDSAQRHAYLLTFTTKGTRLHGDPRGSVTRRQNLPGTPLPEPDPALVAMEEQQQLQPPVALDELARTAVQEAILETCRHRGWDVLALHVRTNHVHLVVQADAPPERVMNDLKAYTTRRLRHDGIVGDQIIWTRHGSTRWLNYPKSIEAAVRYVVEEQGEAMRPAAFVADRANEPDAPVPDIAKEPAAPAALPYGRASLSSSSGEWQGQLRFYPARYAKTFQTWHENIRDWCISRQLWWGHRIPVWSRRMSWSEWKRQESWAERCQFLIGNATTDVCVRVTGDNGEVFQLAGSETAYEQAVALRDRPNPDEPLTWHVCLRDELFQPSPHGRRFSEEMEANGFVRDPDVLDTWFSSALWPLSTLGWPDQSAIDNPQSALNVWNPTSVLCTAREIITLWVSRMVMFNLYFTSREPERADSPSPTSRERERAVGDEDAGPLPYGRGSSARLPFRDVFIHAMIQDGEGRKMSKSLGNGVDPVDIIHTHGADALRFTLASMATNTQDVRMPVERDAKTGRNTSPKFDIGRNFCNKLWNAARFALMNLQSVPAPDSRGGSETRPLADQWILSRLMRTMQEAQDALSEYRFDQFARTCYDFFWRDFCDWYLEAIKPVMKDPATAPPTAAVLAAVLDASLRLMHPMIPFITETIWWRLNDVRPQRSLAGVLDLPQSKLLVTARRPGVNSSLISDTAEAIFTQIQEVIVAIRNVRNDYKADPRKPVTVSISATGDIAQHVNANKAMIELLATCRITRIAPNLPAPPSAARTLAAGCEIFIEGLIDPEAERQRIAKRREELNRQITSMKARLANESYINKAPPHLVQQTRDQLAAAEAELDKLG